MAKEALYSNFYPGLKHREPFRDEQSFLRNGYTNVGLTFENGRARFDGSGYAEHPNLVYDGTYSLRMRVTPDALTGTQYLVDFRASSGTGFIRLNGSTVEWTDVGTLYVNGAVSEGAESGQMEIVASGLTLTQLGNAVLGMAYNSGSNLTGYMDLFEVYTRTLTASEATNFANNNWNKELSGFGGQIKSENLVTNGTFDADSDWTLNTGWSISGGVLNASNVAVTSAYQDIGAEAGKTYKIDLDVTHTSGRLRIFLGGASSGDDAGSTSSAGHYSFTFIPIHFDGKLYFYGTGDPNEFTGTIDNLEVYELNPKTLLDFNSTNGVLDFKDKTDDAAITDVTLRKIGSYYASEYNGSASNIAVGNLGTINTLNLILYYDGTDQSGIIDLDGGTNTVSHSSGTLSYWGDNAYINGVDTDTLSMGWNFITIVDTTGTSGSAFRLGYDGTNYFKGLINRCQVYEGVLDIETHTQFWTEALKEVA